MSSSTINPSEKKKRGRPPVDSEQVNARLTRDLLRALDAYAAEKDVGRPEALRMAFKDWASGHGYLAVEEERP